MPHEFSEADFGEGSSTNALTFDESDFAPAGTNLAADLSRFTPTTAVIPKPEGVGDYLKRSALGAADILGGIVRRAINPVPDIEQANEAMVQALVKKGYYPEGTHGYKPFSTPAVLPEGVTEAFKTGVAQPLGLNTVPDEGVIGDIEKGVGKFAAENISSMTQPGVAIPMMLGAKAPSAPLRAGVGLEFAAPMVAEIPESIKAIQQAQTPEDVVSATLGAGATTLLPLGIAKGMNDGVPRNRFLGREVPADIKLKGETLGGGPVDNYDALERHAISEAEKLGSPAAPVEEFSGATENEPFAGQFMRPTAKGMEIRRGNFRSWLESIPPELRENAISQRVLEEHIHRAAMAEDSPVDTAEYWNSLTKAEQIAEHRAYTGKWTKSGLLSDRGVSFSDAQLGHEAIRRRVQRLMNGTTSEIAEAATREKWTLKSLDMMSDLVRNVREIGGTEASKTGLRLLSQLDDNLKAARSAITGEAPAAFDKNAADKEAERVAGMAPAEFAAWAKGTGRGATGAGYDLAKKYGEAGRSTLERLAKQQAAETTEALGRMRGAKPDELGKIFEETTQRSARKQFFDEGLRLLDAGKAVEGGMTPEAAAQEHGVDVRDVQELAQKKAPAAFQKDYDERIGDVIRDGEKQADEYRRLAKTATNPVQAMRYQREADKLQANADAQKKAVPDWEQKSTPAAFEKFRPRREDEGLLEYAKLKRISEGDPKPQFDQSVEEIQNTTDANRSKMEKAKQDRNESGYAYFKSLVMRGEETIRYQKDKISEWEKRQAEQSGPASFQKELPLPERGKEAVERNLFAAPNAKDIEQTAVKHVTEGLSKAQVPDFNQFLGELQSKYGAGMTPEKAFYPWVDAVQKHLIGASGKDVRNLLYKLNLVDDVAQALKPQEKDPVLGSIPDAPLAVELQGKLGAIEEAMKPTKWRTPSLAKKQFTVEQQRRLAALGAILDKLSDEAGGKPKRSTFRKDVGPEDISSRFIVVEPATPVPGEGGAETGEFSQPEIETSRQFRAFTPDQAADPKLVGEAVTAGAREKGEKVSLTKGLLALRDKINDRTILVSAWNDGRRGPVVTNPEGAGNAVKIDGKLFQRYEPTHQMTIRDPVEDFRKVFNTPQAFADWFGEAGIEGTRGMKAAPAIEPIGSRTTPRWQYERDPELITRPGGRAPIPAPEGLVEPPAPEAPSKTARELKTPRFARQSIPAEPLPPKVGAERPVPPPGGPMLPREAQAALEAEGEYVPTLDTPSPELEARGINISPYARGERPGTPKGRPKIVPRRTTVPIKDAPAAFDKMKQAAKEQWDITSDDLKTVFSRKDVKKEIPAILDGADNASGQIALNARESIKLASMDKNRPGQKYTVVPFTKAFKEQGAAEAEALKRRKAAIPYIAAGQTDAHGNWTANKSKLIDWRAKLDIAEAKARSWSQDLNPLKRREGRRWGKAVKEMQEAVDYADAHWSDRTFVEGAQEYRKQVHEAIEFEKLHGSTTVERDNYIPGLFHGDYFAGKRLLGTQYRMPKKFQNPYEAIKTGPYYLASQDVADLAHTRVLTGRRSVERMLWTQTLQGLTDPATGKKVAVEPIQAMKNVTRPDPITGAPTTVKEPFWQMPSPEYEEVRVGNSQKPLAVHRGYARLIRKLLRPDVIEDLPFGKEALATTGILKHGVILLLDSFHPARLGQYAMAMGGKGFRGGYSALAYDAASLPEAVKAGYISQKAADWAMGTVDLQMPRTTRTASGGITTVPQIVKVPRKTIADTLIRNGLNASKITDALYKDAVQNIPFIGEPYHKAISPYNKLIFDRFLPGLMIENAVRGLEEANKANPGTPLEKLAKDVIRDVNTVYGNMGRQGVFKSATLRSMAQLMFLAPMWQEGLIRKEISGATRAAMLPLRGAAALMGKELPYRQGLPALGATGKMMAKGLGTYLALTQIINLITRKHLTFQNEEEDHKWDAYLPVGEKGIWMSPMSVFAETTHDYIRLGETKPQVFDRIVKMGENRLGPIGKMASIFHTGEDPMGYKYSTSGARLRAGLSQITPGAGAAPITLGIPARAAGHALLPNQIAPNPPGALPRQLIASVAGVKTQVGQSAVNQVYHLADRFMDKEGLKKETGWQQVMTDDPSYTRMRSALRNGDTSGAAKIYADLKKTHSDNEIIKAMRLWAKSPFTKSKKENEKLFQTSLSDKELEIYTKANEEREALLDQFYDFVNAQP